MTATRDLAVDPSILPWSYRGSYLCLATKAGSNGVLTPGHDAYLVSHNHASGLPLFALRPVIAPVGPPSGFPKEPCDVRLGATPGRFTWSYGEIVAEATFQSVNCLRLRGTMDMSFDTEGSLDVNHWRNWLFRVPGEEETVEFTSTPNTALRFIAISGTITLTNDAPCDSSFKDNNRRIAVSRKNGAKSWELLIVDREGPYDQPKASFELAQRSMDLTFEKYVEELCEWQVDATDMLACYVMWTSTVRRAGFIPQEAVLMSKLWMNKVWSWDNCFNGLALPIERALDQITLPFHHITSEGRLPDSMTRNELLYDYTKPPIYGWTLFKLVESGMPMKQIEPLYDGLCAFTDFWFRHRSTGVSQLPYYSHGNDSGWDNATCYDRQTVTVSPDLAALLVIQADFMAKLATHVGREASHWSSMRDLTKAALLDELWDGNQFLFKDAYDGSTWTSTSLLACMPLVAAAYLPETIVDKLAKSVKYHLTGWGLATERPDSEFYEADGYWRGPVWAPPTILIESGLRAAGREGLANEIRLRYIDLCAKNGFAENFDAQTGKGNRDLSYTWSASTYLTFRREMLGNE